MMNKLKDELRKLQNAVEELSRSKTGKYLYTNSDLREILHVNDKLIRKYRNNGLLPYSCEQGKYWYSNEDIDSFLTNTRAA